MNPASKRDQLCYLAILAGPNPTGPDGMLPRQSTPDYHRQLKTPLLEALRFEMGVTNIRAQTKKRAAMAYERAHSVPKNNPRKTLLEEPCRD